ncbi:MAG: hypothetical protein EAX91_01990 [Candidatus Lokiarchaeota archaeon]|nr:hypothetical protein [Candidatus Lokiarchaeota archaeon]
MRKRNIAFILFAVAGVNLLTLPILILIYTPLFAQLGLPSTVVNRVMMTVAISGVIPAIALIIAGIIVLIKFRNT